MTKKEKTRSLFQALAVFIWIVVFGEVAEAENLPFFVQLIGMIGYAWILAFVVIRSFVLGNVAKRVRDDEDDRNTKLHRDLRKILEF